MGSHESEILVIDTVSQKRLNTTKNHVQIGSLILGITVRMLPSQTKF